MTVCNVDCGPDVSRGYEAPAVGFQAAARRWVKNWESRRKGNGSLLWSWSQTVAFTYYILCESQSILTTATHKDEASIMGLQATGQHFLSQGCFNFHLTFSI